LHSTSAACLRAFTGSDAKFEGAEYLYGMNECIAWRRWSKGLGVVWEIFVDTFTINRGEFGDEEHQDVHTKNIAVNIF